MSVLDASFIHADRPAAPLHVGSLCVFEGPAPAYDDVLQAIESRLHLVPRYRQKVLMVPMNLAAPAWVDDTHFSIKYHIRHSALPRPGDDDQLRRMFGRLLAVPLDFRRSPWEIWIIEGLAGGRWAMVCKTHHCMIDGMSGADIISLLMAGEPDARVEPGPQWSAEPEPSVRELAAKAAAHAVTHRVRRAGELFEVVLTMPRQAARTVAATLSGVGWAIGSASTDTFELNGPISPHRRWTWARADLADVKSLTHAGAVTLNDVILAAISLGLRTWLIARGSDTTDGVVTSMVPVSTRPKGVATTHDNQVSAMFADLPVGIEDPADVLREISGQLLELKSSGETVSFSAMLTACDFLPASLLALGARLVAVAPTQRLVSTVTTNVPGSPVPLYLLGCRMLEAFPFIPLANGVRLGFGIFTYAGGVYLGITGDYEAMPDLDNLGTAVEDGFAALLASVA